MNPNLPNSKRLNIVEPAMFKLDLSHTTLVPLMPHSLTSDIAVQLPSCHEQETKSFC